MRAMSCFGSTSMSEEKYEIFFTDLITILDTDNHVVRGFQLISVMIFLVRPHWRLRGSGQNLLEAGSFVYADFSPVK